MATERMTATEWAGQGDPRPLLEFAAPRICHRHLCLVQVELAERAWSASRHAMAFAPALVEEADRLAGLVRQWCFFRISDEALRVATRALDAARPVVSELLPRPGGPNAFGLLAIVRAAAFACGVELPERPEAVPRGAPTFAPVLAALRALHPHGPEGRVAAGLAGLVRRRIPYPATVNREWVAFPGIVFAGEFVLRIGGTRIGDAVPRALFPSLTGARAVAFDEAQQNASAESEAQARDRATASVRLAARLRALEVEAEAAAREALEAAEVRRRAAAAELETRARAEAEQARLVEAWRVQMVRDQVRQAALLASANAPPPAGVLGWLRSIDVFSVLLVVCTVGLPLWLASRDLDERDEEDERAASSPEPERHAWEADAELEVDDAELVPIVDEDEASAEEGPDEDALLMWAQRQAEREEEERREEELREEERREHERRRDAAEREEEAQRARAAQRREDEERHEEDRRREDEALEAQAREQRAARWRQEVGTLELDRRWGDSEDVLRARYGSALDEDPFAD